MREIEADGELGTLLCWVENGEEVIVTRHGKAIARLIPERSGHDPHQSSAAARRIRARAATLKGGAFDWQEWKAGRDNSRP